MSKIAFFTFLPFLWFPMIISAQTSFSKSRIISNTFDPRVATSVLAFDIDNDGDIDLLTNTYNPNLVSNLKWFENAKGNGSFTNYHIIENDYRTLSGLSVDMADLDNDGDWDILSTSDREPGVAWYKNLDGSNDFSSNLVLSNDITHSNCIRAADIDNDNYNDVLFTSYMGELFLCKNTDGHGAFTQPVSINNNEPGYSEFFAVVDVDNDADMDIILFTESKVIWYENTNGLGAFGPEKTICQSTWGMFVGYVADLDNDNNLDILTAPAGKLAWCKNTDGHGTFSSQKVISNSQQDIRAIYAADLDNDNDRDVLIAMNYQNKISWYNNTNGNGVFSFGGVIDDATPGAGHVSAADLDNDGDQDVIGAYSKFDDVTTVYDLVWYENLTPVSVREEPDRKINYFRLEQNYPNPFNPATTIRFNLPGESYTRLKIYNLAGQELATLINNNLSAGEYQVKWTADDLPTGLYFYKLVTENYSVTKKMILQK
jgi:hypothetical protein